MTTQRRLSVFSIFLVFAVCTTAFSLKGDYNDAKFRSQNLNLVVKGTSTLHDWEMKSSKGYCEVLFAMTGADKLVDLTGLNFNLPAESLKSESSMMDNNTYKALKTGVYKNISFVSSSGSVTQVDAFRYQVKAIGKLTIAGNTRETDLSATLKYNAADKSFTVSGVKKMKMTDYGVKPPTVMMGAIKTGNEISIVFNSRLLK